MFLDLVCRFACLSQGISGISRCFGHLDREAGRLLRVALLCIARGSNPVPRRLVRDELLLDLPRFILQVLKRPGRFQGSGVELLHVELGRRRRRHGRRHSGHNRLGALGRLVDGFLEEVELTPRRGQHVEEVGSPQVFARLGVPQRGGDVKRPEHVAFGGCLIVARTRHRSRGFCGGSVRSEGDFCDGFPVLLADVLPGEIHVSGMGSSILPCCCRLA
jgi:hypothetical protein